MSDKRDKPEKKFVKAGYSGTRLIGRVKMKIIFIIKIIYLIQHFGYCCHSSFGTWFWNEVADLRHVLTVNLL